jgi:phage terminase small subunit
MKNSPKAPSDLQKQAKKLWISIQADYQIEDSTGLAYLTSGCRHFQRMEEARVMIQAEGSVITDRFQQKKPHPATIIERDACQSMLRCFKMLNLDLEPLKTIGRPPGR